MREAILGGALAVALWGGVAFAKGETMTKTCAPEGQASLGTGGSAGQGQNPSADLECPDVPDDTTQSGAQQPGTRGEVGTGGTGVSGTMPQHDTNVVAVPPVVVEDEKKEESKLKPDAKGVTVLAGAGVEGYTGDFAAKLNPGPAWDVGVALKPLSLLGVEFGYSGAVNNIDGSGSRIRADEARDADIVRNGGSAIATIGFAPAWYQPYVLGGIGLDHYNVRHPSNVSEFEDDTMGSIPLGIGFRTHVGDFTADIRGVYGMLFNQGLLPAEGNTDLGDIGDETPAGRFAATLRIGGTF